MFAVWKIYPKLLEVIKRCYVKDFSETVTKKKKKLGKAIRICKYLYNLDPSCVRHISSLRKNNFVETRDYFYLFLINQIIECGASVESFRCFEGLTIIRIFHIPLGYTVLIEVSTKFSSWIFSSFRMSELSVNNNESQ